MPEENIKTNRGYKDSVFTTLFNSEEKMLELYNAINKTSYTDLSKIKVRTLTDVLYKALKNDLAFTYEDKVVILIEHQSTINKNMPLRLLMYIARTYEKIVHSKPIYHETIIQIPTPEIIVLYNGKEEYPSETILTLSDAYKQKQAAYCLNLDVKVVNINYNKNNSILSASPTLAQYSYFIYQIRNLIDSGATRDQAIQKSIATCISENILKDFLTEHGAEVCNMLYAEYDIEEALKAREEDGMEKGIAEGIEKGIAKGIAEGISRGKLEAKFEAVKKLIKLNKFTLEDISDIQDLPLDVVKKIAKNTTD